jgi:hypothetical protein
MKNTIGLDQGQPTCKCLLLLIIMFDFIQWNGRVRLILAANKRFCVLFLRKSENNRIDVSSLHARKESSRVRAELQSMLAEPVVLCLSHE